MKKVLCKNLEVKSSSLNNCGRLGTMVELKYTAEWKCFILITRWTVGGLSVYRGVSCVWF